MKRFLGLLGWVGVILVGAALGLSGVAGMIAGVVHLAYHMGAIRQIDRSIRGPSAED